MKARTLRAHLKMNNPHLWAEVQRAGLARATLFGLPLPQISGVTLTGSRTTPVGSGPMLCIGTFPIDGSIRNEAQAWKGVAHTHLQFNGPEKTDVLWAVPRTSDPAGLAVKLQLALASWGASPPPRPGSAGDRVLGRLLTQTAAENEDIPAMEQACRQHGIDDPEEYEPILRSAACRGDIECVRSLLRLVGSELAANAYVDCEYATYQPLSRERCIEVGTYVRAGIPVLPHQRVAVAYALVQYVLYCEEMKKLGRRLTGARTSATGAQGCG